MSATRKINKDDRCRICNEAAIYSYFGVVVCTACKMFFKRNASKKQKTSKCLFNERCEINAKTRHVCSACRLKKCLETGMRVEMIRHWSGNTSQTKRSETNANAQALRPVVTHFSRPNMLPLSNDQWTLLTALTRLYDLPKIFHLVQSLDPSSAVLDTMVLKLLLNAFSEEAGEACRRNVDYQALSLADRSILLPTAIDNIHCLGGIFTCAQTQLVQHQGFAAHINDMYGLLMMSCHRWATTFVQCDDILFKLALALFALSTNSRTLQRHLKEEYADVKTILDIENRYAELTWKYLLYKYSWKEAVKRYVQLIRWFLAMCVFMRHAHHSETHTSDLDSLVEEVEIKFLIEDFTDVGETMNWT